MPDEEETQKPANPKRLGIKYVGELGEVFCPGFGIFRRHVIYPFTEAGEMPSEGSPRISRGEAVDLIAQHSVTAMEFERDRQGNVKHHDDGTPKVKAQVGCPFELAEID